jgi:hypothetical protein
VLALYTPVYSVFDWGEEALTTQNGCARGTAGPRGSGTELRGSGGYCWGGACGHGVPEERNAQRRRCVLCSTVSVP